MKRELNFFLIVLSVNHFPEFSILQKTIMIKTIKTIDIISNAILITSLKSPYKINKKIKNKISKNVRKNTKTKRLYGINAIKSKHLFFSVFYSSSFFKTN